jgi:hypothetical protein
MLSIKMVFTLEQKTFMIESYFRNGHTFRETGSLSVTAERYGNNILDVFINQLHDDELAHGYIQQDGATAHTTRKTLRYLRQFFDDRLINRDLWPALTPLDYYLLLHLKNTIFKDLT